MVELFRFFSRIYRCRVAGFCVMGNHYHLVVSFDEYRELTQDELFALASHLYPKTVLEAWLREKWTRFNERIFDVSELMRNLQASFAKWFNQTFARKGRLWGDRFKSTLLEDEKALLDCLLYVELNPVRAGLVQKPEEYQGSSLYYREVADDRWMIPLTKLTGRGKRKDALIDYRARTYYRGNVPSKERQQAIPDRIILEEEAQGFASQGLFRKRLRYYVDGMVVGGEEFVRSHLERLRSSGHYRRRCNPISQAGGLASSLREQRGTA
jgi:REP element-mobilizing transposase RayT